MQNLLVSDLLQVAGPVFAEAANALPASEKVMLQRALEHGAALELRITLESSTVALWAIRPDGEAFEVAKNAPPLN